MRDSDELLLKSFAINRDEAAFRTLAERYLGLVFHTALRRTQNRPLAEEVSQNILCALAKKASSLAKNPDLLPAWLHRATLYESSKAMRSESSYQRRKQLQHPDAIPESNSSWDDAIPHLDQALDKLPESDRSVLILHYFENRPFPKIAQASGKNPTAVQKQSQRALEKLARILRGKGVTLSATAIATGLAGELAKAAPVTLLQSATAAVLSGTATYSTTGLTLMFATKSKVFIPVVALLCAAPLALQQVAISNAGNQNDALRAKLSSANNPTSQITQRRNMTAARGSAVSSNLDILVLAEEQAESRRIGGLKRIAFIEKLAALPPESLVSLIKEGAVLRIQQDKKTGVLEALISVLAKKDSRLAVTTAIDAFPAGPEFAALIAQTQVAYRFGEWADADPEGALAWFHEQEKSEKFNPPSFIHQSSAIDDFKSHLICAVIHGNAPEVIHILQDTPLEKRTQLLERSLQNHSNKKPLSAAYIEVIRELVSGADFDKAIVAVGATLGWTSGNGMGRAADFFQNANLNVDEMHAIALSIAEATLGQIWIPPEPQLTARMERELLVWIHETLPDLENEIMESARAKVAAGRAFQAEHKIKQLQNETDLTDARLASGLKSRDLGSHLREALELARRIQDPDLRASVIDHLNQR